MSAPDPAQLLAAVAEAFNACEAAGVKLRLRHGIVKARGAGIEGYVIDFSAGWAPVTRIPAGGSPPPEADEDGADDMAEETEPAEFDRDVHPQHHQTGRFTARQDIDQAMRRIDAGTLSRRDTLPQPQAPKHPHE